MTRPSVVSETDIPEYPLRSRGKVRDIYEIDERTLLIVTTDRISAFDVVLPDPIPHKGIVLNRITLFWMDMFKDLVGNHILAREVADFPKPLHAHADILAGRAVLVQKARPLPVECIVRGYITGSGWSDYKKTGMVSGHRLPVGLKESQKLAEPLFTPSTKAEQGLHDENISVAKARELAGAEVMRRVEELSLAVYGRARDFAAGRGIIIADTKFEFGLVGETLTLIDEVLTPDSSRFWPANGFAPGRGQPSFDKQFVRDWLVAIGFNKKPPAPSIPAEIARKTRDKYLEAYRRLTGTRLELD
jgi:phosphoribosylaminoimidazole-succinocarboxamide synthase